MNNCFIIFNGPSSRLWLDHAFNGPVLGCNFAYRDFPLTACFAVDRFTVAAIRGESHPDIEYWTKQSSLELPPGWLQQTIPGIDSGTFAMQHAYQHYPDMRKIIIGADGILGQDHTTHYQYNWRGKNQPHPKTHSRHRKTVLELLEKYNQPTVFISKHTDPQLETMTYADYTREKSLALHAEQFEYTKARI